MSLRERFLTPPKGYEGYQYSPALSPVRAVTAPAALGVTIVSPAYRHLADEAISRFRKHTGLDVVALQVSDSGGFAAKLNLDLFLAPGPIVFFDVDLWIIRKFDFTPLLECGQWCAVPDPGAFNPAAFPHTDSESEGWNKADYFNSGLFVCDLSRPDHRKVFEDARRKLAAGGKKPSDWTDQFWLNWAVQQQPGLLQRLPFALNFYKLAVDWGSSPNIPREIIGLHAAGAKLNEKLAKLKREEAVFGEPVSPMLL